jgi:hypothetical protein
MLGTRWKCCLSLSKARISPQLVPPPERVAAPVMIPLMPRRLLSATQFPEHEPALAVGVAGADVRAFLSSELVRVGLVEDDGADRWTC